MFPRICAHVLEDNIPPGDQIPVGSHGHVRVHVRTSDEYFLSPPHPVWLSNVRDFLKHDLDPFSALLEEERYAPYLSKYDSIKEDKKKKKVVRKRDEEDGTGWGQTGLGELTYSNTTGEDEFDIILHVNEKRNKVRNRQEMVNE